MYPIAPEQIVQWLEAPTADRRPIYARIVDEASVESLIAALQQAKSSLVRSLLCDMLGERHEATGVPALLACLYDTAAEVRSSAADALAKIRSAEAGPILFRRLAREESDSSVQQMLAAAVGAVGYVPAIPTLIEALEAPDPVLRGCAAWSLGVLGAQGAMDALRQRLKEETNVYARTRMEEAINRLTQNP